MKAKIAGIFAWYPDEIRKNSAWPDSFARFAKQQGDRTFNDIPQGLDKAAEVTNKYLLQEQTDPFLGVHERRFADKQISAVDAETYAAQGALTDAGLPASAIDVVISYSMVPDNIMPVSAGAVAENLGIKNALAFGMDAACASITPQLITACSLINSSQANNVLITQSHLLLRAFPQLHPAAPGLGDTATAIVISKKGRWPILGWHGITDGRYHKAVTWVREQEQKSMDNPDLPWWQAGGNFQMGSHDRPAAKDLMRDTVSIAAKTLTEVASKAGINVKSIELLASVQPRGWIPRAIAEVLEIDNIHTPSVYETRGHLGACGPIANLYQAHQQGLAREVKTVALYAQGAGFTRSAILLSMNQ